MSAVISRAVQNMKAGSCTMLHLFDFFSFFLHVFTLFQDLRATQILICMISVVWHAMNPGDTGAMRDSDLSSPRSAGQQEEHRIVMVSWW